VSDPDVFRLTLAGFAVLVGSVAMRATGMGFALLSTPFLIMALGPYEGVLVTNVCGVVAALLNLTQVHADIEWRRALSVVPAGLLGTLPGAVLVMLMPSAVLMIAVSVLVIVGLLVTLSSRSLQVDDSMWVGAVGGLSSGFMNVTAGVAAPGLVIYALATRWEHRRFAATVQVHFVVLGTAALASKWALPTLPAAGWFAMIAVLVAGVLGGGFLTRWIDGERAMRWIVALAMAGAVLSLAQGVSLL
jgi:uncharacterized protein